MRVVDDTEDRTRLRGCGQHAEDGTEDRAVRKLRRRGEVERCTQCLPLGCRNPIDKLDDRRQQFVESRKGDLRLCLDTRRLQHIEPLCSFDRVREERCLSGPSRATDHQHAALAGTRVSEEPFDPTALDGAPVHKRS